MLRPENPYKRGGEDAAKGGNREQGPQAELELARGDDGTFVLVGRLLGDVHISNLAERGSLRTHSFSPKAGLSFAVCDCHDFDPIRCNPIDDYKWKML